MANSKRPRRIGAEFQISQARRSKSYNERFAKALGNGSLGRASHHGERAVKDLLTKDSH